MTIDEYRDRIDSLNREEQAFLRDRLLNQGGDLRLETSRYAASASQRFIWSTSRIDPMTPSYNNAACARIRGPLAADALERALNMIVGRHPPLRSRFEPGADGNTLHVIVTDVAPRLEFVDVSEVPAEWRESEARRIAVDLARRPFDLERGPVFRAHLIRLAPDDHLLAVVVHHIVSDGWSFRVLLGEIVEHYRAQRNGRGQPAMPPLTRTYHECVQTERLFERSKSFRGSLDYWRRALAASPALMPLPWDRPRPAVRTGDGARVEFAFTAETTALLQRRSGALGCTSFIAAYASFVALLARYTGQRDLCVGTPILGRDDEEAKRLIGLFVNMVVLRTQFEPADTFRSLTARVTRVIGEAFDHSRVPLAAVVEALAPQRSPSYTPLYQVLFAMNNAPDEPLLIDDLRLEPVTLDLGTSQTDLGVSVRLSERGITGFVDYSADLFDGKTVERLIANWERLTASALKHPDHRLTQLDFLAPEERATLTAWSMADDHSGADSPTTVDQIILAWADANPSETAVIADETAHTYGELSLVSGRVAAMLRARGVRPGEAIGFCALPSFRAIAALIGILRSGAAYVPVTSETPRERAEVMLRLSSCTRVICDDAHRHLVPPELEVLDLDAACESSSALDDVRSNDPEKPCYVLFTSGSTGVPKGVVVPHAGVASRLRAFQRRHPFTAADRVLQHTSMGFDVSALEIFGSLAAGATLIVALQGNRGDARQSVELIARQGVTVLLGVSSWLRLLLSATGPKRYPRLRYVIAAGEALHGDLVHEIRRCSDATVINAYGPTEAIIVQTTCVCDGTRTAGPVPLGRPLGDARVWVLDEHLCIAPIGVEGEIFIGGPSLADGYVGQPEMARERFVRDPSSTDERGRLYRTGDRARWTGTGDLEFRGRADNQVKVNGVRIELEEIERVLNEDPGIAAAVVVVSRTGDVEGLVAVVVPNESTPSTDSELRRRLSRVLPVYMLPTTIVRRAALPYNSSGKVDRRAVTQSLSFPIAQPTVDTASNEAGLTEPRRLPLSGWFHRPGWRAIAKPEHGAPPPPARILVLGGDSDVGQAVVASLRARGHRVVCVRLASAFARENADTITVDSRSQDSCALLVEQLCAESFAPDALLHLWPLLERPDLSRIDEVRESIERDYAWLDVVPRLAERSPAPCLQVLLVTAGMHAVSPSEVASPRAATLLGAVRVLPREIPGVSVRLLDLASADRAATPVWRDAVLDEVQSLLLDRPPARPGPVVVARRGDTRWERVFIPVALEPHPETSSLFRTRGTYVITGGLGGLGLEVADFLSRVCQANLVLVSRRSMPTREHWDKSRTAESGRLARRLQMLEDRGSVVMVESGDVANASDLQLVLRAARARFGTLHGVIHAAGIMDHATLARRDSASVRRVLEPKVVGALTLLEAVAEDSLDFVALFSSTAAQLGGVGALDYSAANNFLDVLASSRQGTAPPVVSIGWGLWRDVGAAAAGAEAAASSGRFRAALEAGITPAEGMQAFVRALASGLSHVVVSPHDLVALIDGDYDLLIDSVTPRAPMQPPIEHPPSDSLTAADDQLTAEVSAVWRDVLQMSEIGLQQDFFEIGGQSLQLVNLANRLSRQFGRLVPMRRLIFEPTIETCVRILRGG